MLKRLNNSENFIELETVIMIQVSISTSYCKVLSSEMH